MTKDNAKDYLPLVQALAEGKVIQYRRSYDSRWVDMDYAEEIAFMGDVTKFRIKPTPRKAWVWWPAIDDSTLTRPAVVFPKERAEEWVQEFGGHITEVADDE